MTDYILKISSWDLVGGTHYYGRAEGPSPRPCHGNSTIFKGGLTVCSQGHALPRRVEWQIQQPWTAEDYVRYHDRRFEPPSPDQFSSKQELLRVAAGRFTGEIIQRPEDEVQLPDAVQPGDRLWHGWVSTPDTRDEVDYDDLWGLCIAKRTPDWWTPGQVCNYLKISDGTLLYWARHGHIQYERRQRRWRYYPRDEVMRMLRDHKPGQRHAPR